VPEAAALGVPVDAIAVMDVRAAVPVAVSGAGAAAATGRLTTADRAEGQDVAVGTDTGDFTVAALCGLRTPTSRAATIFGTGGGPAFAGEADAGTPPAMPAPVSAATAIAIPMARRAKRRPANVRAINTSQQRERLALRRGCWGIDIQVEDT
jgi:hypothetical protein